MNRDELLRYMEYRERDAIRSAVSRGLGEDVLEFLRILFAAIKLDISVME